MTLLKYGELRKKSFAPAFDLIVYGFSAGEANRIMRSLAPAHFERGELLRRLRTLERLRKLPDGFTTCLSRDEVMRLVKSLPDVLLERTCRMPQRALRNAQPITDDDRLEMGEKAKNLIASVNLMSDRMRLQRINGREWQENPGRLLQREVGIDFC